VIPEVVQDLREHDQVEAAGRPLPGHVALLDPDVGKFPGALGGRADGGRGEVA